MTSMNFNNASVNTNRNINLNSIRDIKITQSNRISNNPESDKNNAFNDYE